jgi:hypothetical protein
MITNSAIRIIQPIIGQPHAGTNRCAQPIKPIYVSASMTVKNRRALLCAGGTAGAIVISGVS